MSSCYAQCHHVKTNNPLLVIRTIYGHVTDQNIERRKVRGDNDTYSLYEYAMDQFGIAQLTADGDPVLVKIGMRRIKHRRVQFFIIDCNL